jgi:competence protein ComEA
MKAFTRSGAAWLSRGLRGALERIKTRLAGALAAAQAWRWGAVFGRAALAALGLVLLGAIGRSARARNILSTDAPPPADAGASIAVLPPAHEAALSASNAAGPSTPPIPSATPPPAATTPVPAPAAPAPEAARGRATADDPVYLNQATLTDLHRIPGIGPKRAEAVLALRTRLGHFRQIEDLLKVKGIGRSSLRKIRPLVRLDPPPAKLGDGGVDGHG